MGRGRVWMTCRVGRDMDVDVDVELTMEVVVTINIIEEEGRMIGGIEAEVERRACRSRCSLTLAASCRGAVGIGVEDCLVPTERRRVGALGMAE